jgi:hypothetical protein
VRIRQEKRLEKAGPPAAAIRSPSVSNGIRFSVARERCSATTKPCPRCSVCPRFAASLR